MSARTRCCMCMADGNHVQTWTCWWLLQLSHRNRPSGTLWRSPRHRILISFATFGPGCPPWLEPTLLSRPDRRGPQGVLEWLARAVLCRPRSGNFKTVQPWEDIIDPLWNELLSFFENLWLACNTGYPVNLHEEPLPFFPYVNEMLRSPTGNLYDVSTLAAALSADIAKGQVALPPTTTPHYSLSITRLWLGAPRTKPLGWTCRRGPLSQLRCPLIKCTFIAGCY